MSARRATRSATRAASDAALGLKPSKAASPAARQRPASSKTSTASASTIAAPSKVAASKAVKPQSTEMPTLHFASDSALDSWLLASGSVTPSGIWLKISKKAILEQVPSVSYHEAVDTALCHGWIDGQRKALDANYFLQRFTPRRKNSLWSRRNVERVELLTNEGRMRPAGQAEIDAAKSDGRWDRAYSGPGTMAVPKDFEEAMEENDAAKEMFESLNKSQRYSFTWRIETAKRPETRQKKIKEFVAMLAEGRSLK